MKIYSFLVLGISIIIFSYVFNFGTCLSTNQEIWGQFGDYIGGILNPLIGIAVLYYLIKSYQTQQEELVKTTSVLDEQKQLIEIQNFENHFFKLLEKFNDILKETEYRRKFSIEAFVEILKEDAIIELSNISNKELFIAQYNNFCEQNQSYPHKYINFLYLIVNFINKNTSIKQEDKQKYFNVLKASLSKDELELLSFHFLIDDSHIYLAKQYNLFEYLDFDSNRINILLCNAYKISQGEHGE